VLETIGHTPSRGSLTVRVGVIYSAALSCIPRLRMSAAWRRFRLQARCPEDTQAGDFYIEIPEG